MREKWERENKAREETGRGREGGIKRVREKWERGHKAREGGGGGRGRW